MSAQNLNLVELKNLLSKWKLDCILSHLLAEKIDIDILKMMKPPHIRLLLCNFPLGIQIRFEYNLELWRQEIGSPFHTLQAPEYRLSDLTKEYIYRTEIPFTSKQNEETQTELMINNQNVIPHIPSSQKSASCSPLTDTQSANPLINTKNSRLAHQLDLKKILSHTTYGIDLMQNYRLNKSFSNLERKLLITTIVNYYVKNNKEFNVQTSYSLERSILKMFPSEKLSFYRISKRGRLYMRYIATKTAMKNRNVIFNENSNSLESTVSEHKEEYDKFTDGVQKIQQFNNTNGSIISDMTHYNEDDDNDDAVYDNIESMEGFTAANCVQDTENETEIKIEPEDVSATPSPNSIPNINCKISTKKQQQIEEAVLLFKDFTIPWHKVPIDIISMMENQEELGKRLNAFANLIVDELRGISRNIPMHVLRTVTQQAVEKYPSSLMDRDEEGKILASSNMIPLLSTMRNRNTFLNRWRY